MRYVLGKRHAGCCIVLSVHARKKKYVVRTVQTIQYIQAGIAVAATDNQNLVNNCSNLVIKQLQVQGAKEPSAEPVSEGLKVRPKHSTCCARC
jgi:hypothetical protein